MEPAIRTHSEEWRRSEALLQSSRQADWAGMARAIDELCAVAPQPTSAALHDRARILEEALNTARALRADLVASLVRLNAAARFASRQDSAEPPKS